MFQIADYVRRFERLVGIRYDWLMHVKRYRECAFDVVPVNPALRQKNRVAVHSRIDNILRAANIRHTIYIFRQLSHFFPYIKKTNHSNKTNRSFYQYLVLSALLQPIHLLFAQSSFTSSILFYGVANHCVAQQFPDRSKTIAYKVFKLNRYTFLEFTPLRHISTRPWRGLAFGGGK